jgi:hypothetical protein
MNTEILVKNLLMGLKAIGKIESEKVYKWHGEDAYFRGFKDGLLKLIETLEDSIEQNNILRDSPEILFYDPDKYVDLIQEGIEEMLSNTCDRFELVTVNDKELVYKCEDIQIINGEEDITQWGCIFNKYTGEVVE